MDDLQSGTPAGGGPREDLPGTVAVLRALFHVVLVALIVMSASLNLFMFRQVSALNKQMAEISQYVNEYNSNSVPLMEKVVNSLADYAKSHPDFAPVIRRYIGPGNPAPAAPAKK